MRKKLNISEAHNILCECIHGEYFIPISFLLFM